MAVLLILLAYQLAVKRTWQAFMLNRELSGKLDTLGDLTYQPQYLNRKRTNLDRIINKYKIDSTVFQGRAIAEIAGLAEKENVTLTELPIKDAYLRSDKYLIQRLNFEGDYYSLIRFIQKIHTQKDVGVIRSLSVKRMPDETTQKLGLEVYLQILL